MSPSKLRARVFDQGNFRSLKDWIYFCLEYDLQICDGCRRTARRKPADRIAAGEWYCGGCEPVLHPDLWKAIKTRKSVLTRCDLCRCEVDIRKCWISEDCKKLYCSSHLKPLARQDRLHLAKQYLARWRQPRQHSLTTARDRLSRLRSHMATVDCDRCSFNGQGIYDGDRLVEIDHGKRSCDSAPDTLNCADLEN